MSDLVKAIMQVLYQIDLFSEHGGGLKLRSYQEAAAQAIIRSVLEGLGLTFVVIFPRQSGKNELQAQLETYLLTMLSKDERHAEIVKVSPTWKPQSLNAMRRLERVLSANLMSIGLGWTKEQGYIYRLGKARIYFLSGSPTASIVGATASALLQCDEAQDVSIEKWDKEINPMAASTNATRVFWGTAWTRRTLLAREKRAALKAQQQDGIQRVFICDADQVGAEVPAYARFVAGEVAKLGRGHPFVKTQYFSEEIDSQGGMFTAARRRLMHGDHPPLERPEPGRLYAFLIDVAGQDESAAAVGAGLVPDHLPALTDQNRDSTALSIVEIDLSTLDDELVQLPTYRMVSRWLWTGEKHTRLYARIKALAEAWKPQRLLIDATGVGEGLGSFLERAFPAQVSLIKFTQKSKSDLGWGFLACIETGRYKEYAPNPGQAGEAAGELARLQALFWQQCESAHMEILPGPNKIMRWSVPDGTRDPSGELVHDDLLISAAMCALLDDQQWGTAESAVIQAIDPLAGLGEVF